ncbi:hypothetical protein DMN91_010069 [Ooceraea biroi]|uniref:Uncharacterized protein n=1 Tax=Ooceraea biroi TaxID=2015173 RepID=A0A026WYH0_OOCBI|nr:uncharacterized protein LOC113562804 [Ooceraea biroi]EZA60159.1 hypothetical protein X777_15096 [Ooceraea biroi]RLU17831.1 hypothetical protein DMN91_010069 [Ooceraea biroi]
MNDNKIEDMQLFLMEFLIDTVNIPSVRAIQKEVLPVRTCVSFRILDLDPVNIYQETPTEACACTDNKLQIFKKGKSCLFALSSIVLQKPLHSFPVTMSVYKELPPGVLPDVMLIGTHQIQMRDLINTLLMRQIFRMVHTWRTMKDTFRITTATGQCVGEVTVFIRVSCFGKKIVTQFQIPRSGKPYLFKGVDDYTVFQCKRITSALTKERIECACAPKKINDGSGEAAGICCPVTPDKRREERAKDVYKDKCPPCCRGTQEPPKPKEIIKKCGCVVREDCPHL